MSFLLHAILPSGDDALLLILAGTMLLFIVMVPVAMLRRRMGLKALVACWLGVSLAPLLGDAIPVVALAVAASLTPTFLIIHVRVNRRPNGRVWVDSALAATAFPFAILFISSIL